MNTICELLDNLHASVYIQRRTWGSKNWEVQLSYTNDEKTEIKAVGEESTAKEALEIAWAKLNKTIKNGMIIPRLTFEGTVTPVRPAESDDNLTF